MPADNWVPGGDDIVLSGLSGRLPESNNIEEFAKNLFDGVDMVTDDDRRWTPGLHGLPAHFAKLKDLAHFDAPFFGVNGKQAHLMDPQLRILLELTHEAIVDAGYNPADLRGSRTGVFVGGCLSETFGILLADVDKINGYELTGCCSSMFPNRVSFTFDFKGPSYAIDTGCSSSMHALAQATAAIRTGQCDAAIVAGATLGISPITSVNFLRLNMLSPEGRCAAFDADGRGYVRAEAVVAVLLQRRRDCRRLYCTVRGARLNADGYKNQGVTYPTGASQRQLAQETFEEARLRPQDVAYVEAHGTGTKVGDPEEVNAIAELFCQGRTTPLLMGSLKSNMGHAEPVSGLCSIVKVVVAMESGVIPGNLHYKTPNPDIPALSDGRIKVVDCNTPWQGGLVAVNSFGFGGANAHVILESQDGKRPPPASYVAPRLILASGRTHAAVLRLLKLVADHPRDAELHALLDAVHERNVPGHSHRGFAVLDPERDAKPVMETIEMESSEPRPVWFVFSGMGCQWPGMARQLMRLPTFAASISRLAATLRPLGLDLMHILTEAPEAAFENVLYSLVSITAVQIALVDLLRELGVRPDGIVGFSVGENGCAYADNTLTAEQTILCTYWRARCISDARLPPGAMVTVGLSWEETLRRCPPDVVPACHNSADSVTVSGPPDSIEKFVAEVEAEGVFARRVNSSGVAFHSKYIAPAAEKLRAKLLEVIPEPRPRSPHWVSSSLSINQQTSGFGKLSDAEYHINNFLSPVGFADALRAIPENAVVVEVAPHGLLQGVLRGALPSATHIPLIRREHPYPLTHLLDAIGRLYAAGTQPRVSSLYPPISWPVSRGTPMLASAIEWDHSVEWKVADYRSLTHNGEHVIEYDLSKPDQAFLAGHNIDGLVLFPAAGYLTMVWHTVAKVNNLKMDEAAVVLEDVQILRTTIVPRESPLRFLVSLLGVRGEFEICEGGALVVTGRARLVTDPATERLPATSLINKPEEDLKPFDNEDIYKELRLKGYNYRGLFCGIKCSDARGSRGLIDWDDNWISFIDSMLQFNMIVVNRREIKLPTRISRVVIDPVAQRAAVAEAAGNGVPLRWYENLSAIVAGGVELRGINRSHVPRRSNAQAAPKLEKYVFIPLTTIHAVDSNQSKRNALTTALQLVVENTSALRLRVVELALGRPADDLLLPLVLPILDGEPQVRVSASLNAGDDVSTYAAIMDPLEVKMEMLDDLDSQCQLVLGANVISKQNTSELRALTAALDAQGHLLLEEPTNALDDPGAAALLSGTGLVTVSRQQAADCEYVLLRRAVSLPSSSIIIEVRDDDYAWIDALRDAFKRAENEELRVYVWSCNPDSGVLGLATCLQSEAGGNKLRVYYLPGAKDAFDPAGPAYRAHVQLDLTFNVLRAGVWGTYRHLLLEDTSKLQLQVEHAYVSTLTRGDLSSLRWIESDLRHAADAPQRPNTDLCRVYYAPLNFRDVMLATEKLPPYALPGDLADQECNLGLEFSGRSSSGKRVMGMVPAKGLATTVIADESFMWEVPETWSLKEAATVPVVYATAYYALAVRGRMRRGDSVLIHAGTGGVGQAAISIALHAGCTVFTTVSSAEKRAFLRGRFPTLPDINIGNSRDCTFEPLVLQRTRGRGVDLVLNSLAGDQLQASIRCLAIGGSFLEIGKVDLSTNSPLGMAALLKNITIHGILLDTLFDASRDRRDSDKAEVVRCVTEGIASGAVRPLPSTVYADNELEQAFRYMATGKHIGKVLIRVCEEETSGHSPQPRLVSALRRTYMHPAKSYVLVGGLGGFGLELGEWLINLGARTIVVNSRSEVRTGYQAWCIRRWRERGVRVEVSTLDATVVAGARALLSEAARAAPIGGIFNLAAVLKNGIMENQSPERFRAVCKPKIEGTRALDAASRDLALELDYFVVFSSVACGRGSYGQSNYGFANSVMERICEQRQADGLPAMAIQWGPIADVGMVVVAMQGHSATDMGGGTLSQRITSCMTALGSLLALPDAVTSSIVVADKHQVHEKPSQELELVVANILGLGINNSRKVSDTATFAELGMDSLMGAEIKQILERGYDILLGVQEIRVLTFGKLRSMGEEASAHSAPEKTVDQSTED